MHCQHSIIPRSTLLDNVIEALDMETSVHFLEEEDPLLEDVRTATVHNFRGRTTCHLR
jgi:hypothetical protein